MKHFSLLLCTLLFSTVTLANTLLVENPYVRATPPHAKNSAAFLTVINNNERTVKLVAAKSDIAERVELHNHIHEDGMMKMRQVEAITVSANSSAKLQPGGYHVMFLGLKQDLVEGQVVNIKLYFDNGDELTVKAPVKKITMKHH